MALSSKTDKTAHPSSPAPGRVVSRTPRAPGAPAPTPMEDEQQLELPHEADQSTRSTDAKPNPAMRRAHKDLQEGQVDTDMRATPGLDAERRKSYVPGAGGTSPGQQHEQDKPGK